MNTMNNKTNSYEHPDLLVVYCKIASVIAGSGTPGSGQNEGTTDEELVP